MTDKERIFQRIINLTLSPEHKSENSPYWEYINSSTILEKGDIIAGCTNGGHDFSISFFIEKVSESELIVQEIGTKRTTRYHNEMFKVLRNFPSLYKLTGHEWKVRLKIGSAINIDYYMYALVETKFDGKNINLTFRKKWTSLLKEFTITYKGPISRLSIKQISELLRNTELSKW